MSLKRITSQVFSSLAVLVLLFGNHIYAEALVSTLGHSETEAIIVQNSTSIDKTIAADDFYVPHGTRWTVQNIVFEGDFVNAAVAADITSVNVYIIRDDESMPTVNSDAVPVDATEINYNLFQTSVIRRELYTEFSVSDTDGDTLIDDITVTFSNEFTIPDGRFWLVFQVNMDGSASKSWRWDQGEYTFGTGIPEDDNNGEDINNKNAVWQTTEASAACENVWGKFNSVCSQAVADGDLSFQINGEPSKYRTDVLQSSIDFALEAGYDTSSFGGATTDKFGVSSSEASDASVITLVADDFSVPAGKAWIVDGVIFRGELVDAAPASTSISQLNLYVLPAEADGSWPASAVLDGVGDPADTIKAVAQYSLEDSPLLTTSSIEGDNSFGVQFTQPIIFTEGSYWLAVQVRTAENDHWRWLLSRYDAANGLPAIQQQLTGSDCVANLVPVQCDSGISNNWDVAFSVIGTEREVQVSTLHREDSFNASRYPATANQYLMVDDFVIDAAESVDEVILNGVWTETHTNANIDRITLYVFEDTGSGAPKLYGSELYKTELTSGFTSGADGTLTIGLSSNWSLPSAGRYWLAVDVELSSVTGSPPNWQWKSFLSELPLGTNWIEVNGPLSMYIAGTAPGSCSDSAWILLQTCAAQTVPMNFEFILNDSSSAVVSSVATDSERQVSSYPSDESDEFFAAESFTVPTDRVLTVDTVYLDSEFTAGDVNNIAIDNVKLYVLEADSGGADPRTTNVDTALYKAESKSGGLTFSRQDNGDLIVSLNSQWSMTDPGKYWLVVNVELEEGSGFSGPRSYWRWESRISTRPATTDVAAANVEPALLKHESSVASPLSDCFSRWNDLSNCDGVTGQTNMLFSMYGTNQTSSDLSATIEFDESSWSSNEEKAGDVGEGLVDMGDTLYYTVTVLNSATGANLNTVEMKSSLPPKATFVPASSSSECSEILNVVTCVVPGGLVAGDSHEFTVAVTVDTRGFLSLSMTATTTEIYDTDLSNNLAVIGFNVAGPDLALNITQEASSSIESECGDAGTYQNGVNQLDSDCPDPTDPVVTDVNLSDCYGDKNYNNDILTYFRVTVKNEGDLPILGADGGYSIDLSSERFNLAAQFNQAYGFTTGAQDLTAAGSGDCTATMTLTDDLNNGESRSFVIKAYIREGQQISNSFDATLSGVVVSNANATTDPESTPTNNSVDKVITLDLVDLGIEMVGFEELPSSGEVEYRIRLTNHGNVIAKNIQLKQTFFQSPVSALVPDIIVAEFSGAPAGTSNCGDNDADKDGEMTCVLDELAGASGSNVIDLRVVVRYQDDILKMQLDALVVSSGVDFNLENNHVVTPIQTLNIPVTSSASVSGGGSLGGIYCWLAIFVLFGYMRHIRMKKLTLGSFFIHG